MKTTAASIAAFAIAAYAAAFAPPANAATDLVQAWQAAREHDPAFAAARAQREAGQTKQRQGRALLLPQVTASGSASYITSDRNTTGAQFSAPGFGTSNDVAFSTHIDGGTANAWSVSAQQPLYNAERLASSRQLDRQALLAEAQFRAAEQELALRTARAYFAVLLAEETLATLRAQKESAQRAFEVAKEKFEAGATPVTDRDEARARFDDIAAQELVLEDDLKMKRVALADLTGNAAQQLKALDRDAPLDRITAGPLKEWSERAAQKNPLIAMRELGHEVAQQEVEKYRALATPSLDLVARIADERMYGASGFGTTTNITSNTKLVGLQLTIPLFTGGMREARHDEAAALARKAQYDAVALRQEVLRQTQTAWLGVTTGIARVRANDQALKSAQSRLGATETGKEVGARTMLDLMNAQSDFYQGQRNLAQAKYQLLLNRLTLSAMAGELTETELQNVNALLGPAPSVAP